jgi:hypothetical protein
MTNEIVIVSTWGETTDEMRQIIRVVRNTAGIFRNRDGVEPHILAYREVTARYQKCGEIINRALVERVAQHYQADPDKTWALFIEPFGGPGLVSPDFQLNPMFLDPRLPKEPDIDETMTVGELLKMLSSDDYDAPKIDTAVRQVLAWMRDHYEENRFAYAIADVLALVMDMIEADGTDGLNEAEVNNVLGTMAVILIDIRGEAKTLSAETHARLKQIEAVLHRPTAEGASDAPPSAQSDPSVG